MPNDEIDATGRAPAPAAMRCLSEIWAAVGGRPETASHVTVTGSGALPSCFAVTDFAAATVGAAGLAAAELIGITTGTAQTALPPVEVDRRLTSFWFGVSIEPQGWTLPPQWDSVAGDYLAADGWIRLHTNAPHHRQAALSVLGTPADREAVAHAVSKWQASELESAIVAQNGCAAAMRSTQDWAVHPQGSAVWSEPLLHRSLHESAGIPAWSGTRERPLAGIRVLDMTRILAGPVATRFLAGLGAEVLRIDPPGWEEPNTVPDVVLGKRCARLDLKSAAGKATLERLLAEADIVIHGYRSNALAHLGLGADHMRALNPAIIDVALDAYGWSGPWNARRGFDSLVQMSTGIAEAGMRAAQSDRPVPLPLQAIDHGTGYMMAAAAIRGLTERQTSGSGSTVRASLARTAKLLITHAGPQAADAPGLAPASPEDRDERVEATSWGPAKRFKSPVLINGAPLHWQRPARALGSDSAEW